MAQLPWFPLHIADYLADTAHLSTEQHGAYLLLLFHSWRTGPLPDDDEQLANITRMTPDGWQRARPTLLHFFNKDDGDKWRSTRLEAERLRLIESTQRRKVAGSKGGTVSAMRRWHPKK